MDLGSCFTIAGGWFERRLMYKGSSLGFLYGLYVPSVKSSVMSKKFTCLVGLFILNCELVGVFILNKLEDRFENIGLYRDDGLAAIKTTSGRLADKARKQLIETFSKFGLKITATANLRRVNFLDITLDLTDGTYKPYRKPNDEPLYINRLSNHPPAIVKQLPKSINKRINKLSCNKQTFDDSCQLYNDALRQSNFNATLTY